MKSDQVIREEDWVQYVAILSLKLNSGFVIEEKNDKMPFTVLSKRNQKVNHVFNLMMFFITLGLWSFFWVYLCCRSSKKKRIVVAIDEDGKTFVENCF